jgi:hypothetical protein
MQRKGSMEEEYHAYRAIEAKVKLRRNHYWKRVFHLVEALIKRHTDHYITWSR